MIVKNKTKKKTLNIYVVIVSYWTEQHPNIF